MKVTDEELRKWATERVEFKRHFRTYLIINAALWIFWYFSRARYGDHDGYWPLWVSLGWGIGIVSHYLKVYQSNSKAVEREYEKLKRKQDSTY